MAEPNGPVSGGEVPGGLEPIPELTALAQVLHQGRLAMGVSLVELARRLHMGQEQLQALEQADRTRLPEPVFVIAQARRVAAALDVDASALIDALRRCESFKSPTVTLNPEAFKPRPVNFQPASASPGSLPLWWLLPLAVVLVGAAGVWSQRSQLQALMRASPPRASVKPAPVAVATRETIPWPKPAVLRVRTASVSWMEITSLNGQKRLFRGMFRGEQRFPLGQGLLLRAGRPDQVLVATGTAAWQPLGTVKDLRWFRFPQPPAKSKPIKVPSAQSPAQPR